MAWIDIVIVIIIISLIIHGIATGLIRSVFDIAGIIFGYIIAVTYSTLVRIPEILAFLLIFITVLVIFSIAGRIISKIIHITPLGIIDRVLGGVLGLAKGAIICFVFLIVVMLIKRDTRIISSSSLAAEIANSGLQVSRILPKPMYDWIREVFARKDVVSNDANNYLHL
ncbi:MAG: CvpA family protein [candidate division WOR-3 bacterium]|nr:MAG: CvpA family protein [candidate division WOR-3 bacterium]